MTYNYGNKYNGNYQNKTQKSHNFIEKSKICLTGI